MNIWPSLLFLLVGWLLGLAAPLIVDRIRERRQAAQIRSSIMMELAELRYKLGLTVYGLSVSIGAWDRSLLEWLKSILQNYSGVRAEAHIAEAIDKLLARSDKDLAAAADRGKAAPIGAVGLRKYNTPFIDGHIGALAMLPSDFQNLLIEVKAQIAILNEQVDDARFFYRKTFDSDISPENYGVVEQNLKGTYADVCQKARNIADLVSKCLKAARPQCSG